VPEGRTALPAIDRALPRSICLAGSSAWWLEQSSTTDLVGELRDAGALIYEPLRGY
jgi:hypothetical protein